MSATPPPEAPPQHPRRRLGVGAVIVLVLAAFAVTVVIGVVRGAAAPTTVVDGAPGPTSDPVSAAATDGGGVYVDVAGAVRTPGLYRLPPGARLVDAVAAAGGFLPEAERAAVNLARPVSDGEQIIVPVHGEEVDPGTPGGSGLPGRGGGLVDINTASTAELEALPGIGPALAGRIVAWREDNGRFASVDDLRAVSGIGEKVLDGLRDFVRV